MKDKLEEGVAGAASGSMGGATGDLISHLTARCCKEGAEQGGVAFSLCLRKSDPGGKGIEACDQEQRVLEGVTLLPVKGPESVHEPKDLGRSQDQPRASFSIANVHTVGVGREHRKAAYTMSILSTGKS